MNRRPTPWTRLALAAAAATVITATLPAALAQAAPVRGACEARNNNTPAKLLECVTGAGVQRHLASFQAIADANDDPFTLGAGRPARTGTPTAWLTWRASSAVRATR